ncbi:S9 family peptidase [Luteimonas sp. RIT-PG2_3]
MNDWKQGCLALVLVFSASATLAWARTAPAALQAPLPLEVATQMNAHNGRSPIELSPDGQWVAHTFSGAETVARDTAMYTASGFPLAEGNARMHAVVTHTRTGEMIRLGSDDSASWGAVWAPDGRRVAFYSDAGGEAGLWIWDMATRTARRFPGIVVRPFFGFETVRWMADSRRLVSKVLPEGMRAAEANGAALQPEGDNRFRPVGANEASVFVLSSRPPPPTVQTARPPAALAIDPLAAELAVLDVDAGTILRVGAYSAIRYYAISPDQRHLAYTVVAGFEPNSQQPLYDLMLYSFSSGTPRKLAAGVKLAYGLEWSWSPDSRRLAYIASGLRADGAIVVVSLEDGKARRLELGDAPGFDNGNGILPPCWDAQSEHLYTVGKDGKLWRTPLDAGRAVLAGDIEGQRITEIVTSRRRSGVWARDGRIWVLARAKEGAQSGLYGIDPATGQVEPGLVEQARQYTTYFNLDVSEASGEIAYVASDQQRPFDVWLFDPVSGKTRQATHLNPGLERYHLGQARVIEWSGADGRRLRGALLLPPGYQQGDRLPLVVWVYGGANGSESVDSFGLWGKMETFNMHVLATRGYAILYPDAPVDVGTPMKDIVDAVMPSLDAAVQQGYADPDRIAVMGQSYGSYSALALIGHSNRFKAAVLTGAVVHPDLVAGYLEMSPQGMANNIGYYEQGQGSMGGSPWQYRERYLDNSPVFLFDRIETPVLIGQGSQDSRLFASDAIFVGLQRLGKEVEYRIYEGESHVISRRPNVIDFWQRRIDFLDKHLGVSRVDDTQ